MQKAQSQQYTVKDVNASEFIQAYAMFLKKNDKLQIPAWSQFVKTGVHKELAPLNDDWLYVRAACIARRVYLTGHKGVGQFTHMLGDNKRNGCLRNKHSQASQKIIRYCLQELQRIGVVKKDKKHDLKKNSRIITDDGKKDLNQIATACCQARNKQ